MKNMINKKAMEAVEPIRATAPMRASHPDTIWDDEAELVRGAKARSPAAWTEIYNASYRRLFRYALARTSDRAAAEDIASSVFLQALKDIDSFNYRGKPLLAWLFGIARHLVSKHLRSQRRKQTVSSLRNVASRLMLWRVRSPHSEQASADVTMQPAADGDPGHFVERLDVRHALDRLTDNQREVTVLHFYGGFSIPAISLLLGKKERAVYSLHARALDTLRRHLRDD